jgi:hypothetical protein
MAAGRAKALQVMPRSFLEGRGPADRGEHRQAAGAVAARLNWLSGQNYHRYFSSMSEETAAVRPMSEKELRARMDWIIAEEERTYRRLLELRDKFKAVVAELDRAASSAAELPNLTNIVALPSRFPRR